MNTKGIIIRCALASLAVAFTTGCVAPQKTWVYHPNSYTPATSSTGKKVAVLPFEDGRENKNSNWLGMYAVPLVPYGWLDYYSPEGMERHMVSGMWMNYKPTEDYAKALAEDLNKTGLFSEAYFDFRRTGGDYAVTGKIVSTKYDGTVISYGLSIFGPVLWIIGAPASTFGNELSVELTLVDSAANKPVFSKVYTAEPRNKVNWIYYHHDDFDYSEMLAELNKQFCQDIQPIVLGAPKRQASAAAAPGQRQ
jgi:hypothetical protein